MRKRKFGLLLAALGLIVSICACNWTSQTGELRRESETIEPDGAEMATVNVKMGAGELTIGGGAAALAEADFTYNVADWKPTIDYTVSGEQGELWIEQPRVEKLSLESYRYEWELALNDEIPLELDVALGAGESQLDMSTLSLTRLDLKVGAGGVDLDLTGERERDLDVTIRGGVGEATVLLPAEVGVRARAKGGLGEVEVSGLMREGDAYVNEAYGASEATITLDIEGGVGGIELRVVD
jgi:hypothetical protein